MFTFYEVKQWVAKDAQFKDYLSKLLPIIKSKGKIVGEQGDPYDPKVLMVVARQEEKDGEWINTELWLTKPFKMCFCKNPIIAYGYARISDNAKGMMVNQGEAIRLFQDGYLIQQGLSSREVNILITLDELQTIIPPV